MEITTPIMLFPALSLILLAYTEKFIRLGLRSRKLKKEWEDNQATHALEQIRSLRRRLHLIRNMQAFGTGSFFMCITSIFLFYIKMPIVGQYSFWTGMVLMMISLILGFREITLSAAALKLAIDDTGNKEAMA